MTSEVRTISEYNIFNPLRLLECATPQSVPHPSIWIHRWVARWRHHGVPWGAAKAELGKGRVVDHPLLFRLVNQGRERTRHGTFQGQSWLITSKYNNDPNCFLRHLPVVDFVS